MNGQQKFAEAFSIFCNTLGYFGSDKERKDLVQACVIRLHRTTQQALMRNVVLPILQALAEQHANGWTDARNQASCALAHRMLAAVPEDDQYLPLI